MRASLRLSRGTVLYLPNQELSNPGVVTVTLSPPPASPYFFPRFCSLPLTTGLRLYLQLIMTSKHLHFKF